MAAVTLAIFSHVNQYDPVYDDAVYVIESINPETCVKTMGQISEPAPTVGI